MSQSDAKDHEIACEIFGMVFNQVVFPLIGIENTHRYVSQAIDIAGPTIIKEEITNFAYISAHPEYADLFPPRSQLTIDSPVFIKRNIQQQLEVAKRRVSSASLVFAHSIFEACVYDCLTITSIVGWKDWLPEIRDKEIRIAELDATSVEDIYRHEIKNHLKGMQRNPLIKNLRAFFRITKPTENYPKPLAYKYDEVRLKGLDEDRQTAAHHNSNKYEPERFADDVEYLRLTVFYLLQILGEKYKLKNPLPIPTW